MNSIPALQAVTANDLMDGDVVYLTAEHCWSRHLSEAALAAKPDEAASLLAIAMRQEHLVVGPYLMDVSRAAAGQLEPKHYRERIRTLGPSNRPDLGRQAETPAVRRQESAHVSL
jgi:hypothetical protein